MFAEPVRSRLWFASICLVVLYLVFAPGAFVPTAFGQDEDEEEDLPWRPGLVCVSEGSGRITKELSLAPRPASSRVEWTGLLESGPNGRYRLGFRFSGKLLVRLGDEVVFAAESTDTTWGTTEPLDLEYGYHPLSIRLEPGPAKRVRLTSFWEGPRFRFEPIPSRTLFHPRENTIKSEATDRGLHLVRALRCDACHEINGLETDPLTAPPIASEIRDTWLRDFLSKEESDEESNLLSAVHAKFNPQQANDLVAWLRREFEQQAETEQEGDLPGGDEVGDANRGQKLFLNVGCLACHSWDGLGRTPADNLFGGGSLTSIREKRSEAYLRRWLDSPSSVNPNHRMPEFDLSGQEVADLVAFLMSWPPADLVSEDDQSGNHVRGAELAATHNCLSCHTAADSRSKIGPDSDWDRSCVTSIEGGRPGYRLSESDRSEIVRFFKNRSATEQPDIGELLITENSCLSCHARGVERGLSTATEEVAQRFPDLAGRLAAMHPPALNSVGDKLHDRALRNSITRRQAPLRSWLNVRMPKFPLDDKQVNAVAEHFIHHDRVPEEAYGVGRLELTDAEKSDSERLVTSDGFGCMSCHAVGNLKPSRRTPIGQLGPSISRPQQRLRKVWFDRWVRNPARITPRMEMPSVQIPVAGLLDGDLDRQLNALWEVLNQPRFQPPDPTPTRIVRQTGAGGEAAVVLTDVFRLNGRKLIKPFLVGLPNRRNVLIDLAEARIAAVWVGDVARQRTQGKTWFWDAPPVQMAVGSNTASMLLIDKDGRKLTPQRVGQFRAELDEWSHIKDGVELRYRLRFGSDQNALRTVVVREQIVAVEQDWLRRLSFEGLRAGEAIEIRVYSFGQIEPDMRRTVVTGKFEMRYAVGDMVDVGGIPDQEKPVQSPLKRLPVMAGFESTRLSLPSGLMPISLGWRPNGELLVGSLKGRVWRLTDSDGDGLEDRAAPFSDDLAAPYGIHATNDYVDALTKYGIVRLFDQDRDGQADRHQIVASGWGHTDDYHDWVVGLPRDESGAYYASIPCQQDERTVPAAHLRGKVIRLVPRDGDTTDAYSPRAFEIEPISAGHRFPMGIARNRAGQLFVTDNQGNYNPFNELNHVTPGAHFGFINAVEKRAGFKPPPLTPPAIDIPHPWTRSVNGICFLETPVALGDRKLFGPFEGHLLGCEYDTRRLVRMTVETVDGWVQGAAYPLAEVPADGSDGLQGPINCGIAPDGAVYIANIRDSGWGGANNTGSLVRIVPDLAELPAGIAEISAKSGGFTIRFTKPVDRDIASQASNYRVSSVRRISTPAYGGDDVDRREETVKDVRLHSDRMSAELLLDDALRTGFVYEFRLSKLAGDDMEFYPGEAFYTLRRKP